MTTGTALQRLLKYPHSAVFDLAPESQLAFRLQHPSGAKWKVENRVFTATAGGVDRAFDLANHTVDSLAIALVAAGFEVVSRSLSLAQVSAMILVEGSGDQLVSNGDHVYGFTSLLWAILSSYAGESMDAEAQIIEALRQMVIWQSEGEWLDLWGRLYAEARRQGEGDASYAARIPKEAFRLRNNARAIEQAILDATGYDVRINEPWKDIFRLDESVLSGPHKFYDGERIGYHLIEPLTSGVVDWPAVLAVIERNRAAGIKVLGPRLTYGSVLLVDAGSYEVHAGIMVDVVDISRLEDRALLDYGSLEDVSVLNHTSLQLQEVMHTSMSFADPQAWDGFSWADAGTWANTIYVVSSSYSQDYQVYFSSVEYTGQFWSVADRTWADGPPESWSSLNALVTSAYFDES